MKVTLFIVMALPIGVYAAAVPVSGGDAIVKGASPTLAAGAPASALLRLGELRCEYLADPWGIDVARPRLSWMLRTAQRGARQTAYQVVVASTPALLSQGAGDLWDSGKRESDRSVQVVYAGRPLPSCQRCSWKVRVWDQNGRESPWSEPAQWTMGLLKPEDWQAKWIVANDWLDEDQAWIWFPSSSAVDQPPVGTCYFRAHLKVPKNVAIRQARVVMAAADAFTLFINGQQSLQSGDQPAIKLAEVTERLKDGDNVFAVAATNKGRVPKLAGLIGKITVSLADGREVVLNTGSAWKVCDRQQPGWRDAAMDDATWLPARELGKYLDASAGTWDSSQGAWDASRATLASSPGAWNRFRNTLRMDDTYWLRKVFTLDTLPEQAMAHVNVKGYYEIYVNGQKVESDVLSPPVSSYHCRSYALSYNIKPYLRQGKNCVGVWLGYGWYWPGYPGVRHSRPLARVQLELNGGGKSIVIGTDSSWKSRPSTYQLLGYWRYNDFGGERLDTRRDLPDWCQPDLDEGGWASALVIPSPPGQVSAAMCPKNRIGARIPPVACRDLGNGTYELDFGVCLTGWLRLRMPPLDSGRTVTAVYAEKRFQSPHGDDTPAGHIPICRGSCRTFSTANGPVCYQTHNQFDEFISAGKPHEQFCSKFNYHVFRYAIVQNLPAKPSLADAEALLIESDLDPAGSFSCSNKLLNHIYDVTLWSHRGWSLGGCFAESSRERMGYGPIEVLLEPTIMTLDVPALFTKWSGNWLDNQNPTTGENLNTAPRMLPHCGGGPAWAATVTPLSWAMYLYYGDRRILERCYEPGQRYLAFLQRSCQDDLLVNSGPFAPNWNFLGDWLSPDQCAEAIQERPSGLGLYGAASDRPSPSVVNAAFNNCYRVYLWRILERAATVLGRSADARRCAARISEICRRVHQRFYDPQRHTYLLDSQTYQALPLFAQTVPEADCRAVQQMLEDNILVRRHGHLDTGHLGIWFLVQYLQRIGRNDLIYTIVNQKTYPGWGYMVDQGASTLWEYWNGYRGQSCNCYGAIGGWFQQGLAGIFPDPAGPGFQKIIIKPSPVGDLAWVKAHYDSIRGRIRSDWTREGRKFTLNVTIPPNAHATVYVPAKDAAGVTESGRPIEKADGVKLLRMDSAAGVYEIGSGTYEFVSELPGK